MRTEEDGISCTETGGGGVSDRRSLSLWTLLHLFPRQQAFAQSIPLRLIGLWCPGCSRTLKKQKQRSFALGVQSFYGFDQRCGDIIENFAFVDDASASTNLQKIKIKKPLLG